MGSVSGLAVWLVGGVVGRWVGWLVGCLVGCLVVLLVCGSQLTNQPTNQPTRGPASPTKSLARGAADSWARQSRSSALCKRARARPNQLLGALEREPSLRDLVETDWVGCSWWVIGKAARAASVDYFQRLLVWICYDLGVCLGWLGYVLVGFLSCWLCGDSDWTDGSVRFW